MCCPLSVSVKVKNKFIYKKQENHSFNKCPPFPYGIWLPILHPGTNNDIFPFPLLILSIEFIEIINMAFPEEAHILYCSNSNGGMVWLTEQV